MNAAEVATFLEVPKSTVETWAATFAASISPGAAQGNFSTRDRSLLKEVRDWKQNEPGLSDLEITQRLYGLRNTQFSDEP
jgi:hypothetical protein